MTEATTRAVCLMSGGPDSAVALAIARNEGYELHLLFVDYGQRTRARELESTRQLANHFGGLELRTAHLDLLGQIESVPLTMDGEPLTAQEPSRIYVPFRNTILLSLAVAWAEVIDARAVFIGSIGPPWATPDNSPKYFGTFQELVRVGARDGERIAIRAPLCTSSKAEVIRQGLDLQVPFDLTWSCQNYEDAACGLCTSCYDRLGAFELVGAPDPLPYRTLGSEGAEAELRRG